MAFIDDDAIHPQQTEMVADGGLREVELVAEAGDVPFAAGEEHHDLQAGLVGEQPEKLAQVGKGLFIRSGGLGRHISSRELGTTLRHT